MREHTPTQSDDLYDLVSDRAIAGKPLILTSNRAPKDWYPLRRRRLTNPHLQDVMSTDVIVLSKQDHPEIAHCDVGPAGSAGAVKRGKWSTGCGGP